MKNTKFKLFERDYDLDNLSDLPEDIFNFIEELPDFNNQCVRVTIQIAYEDLYETT